MAELKYKPVPHNHKEFLARASTRKGFDDAYQALELEYQVATRRVRAQGSHKTQLPNAWAPPRARSPGSSLRASMRPRPQR